MITIRHNLDETKFKHLWAKYVCDCNILNHCAGCVLGHYSKKFSGAWNKDLLSQPVLQMDEYPDGSFKAIYFCGVFKKGAPKNNYPHNFHMIVIPEEGRTAVYDFENWHVEIDGGYLSSIPAEEELDERFFKEPYTHHHYTCRIFRWMIGFFHPELLVKKQQNASL